MNDASDKHEAFVRLLNESHRRLLGYLMSLLGNRHDAEDVLQRASMTMWRRFETFEPGTDFMAWASTVAFYEAKNFQRVAARSRLRFDDELLNTLAAERLDDLRHLDERFDALEHCVGKLDAANRKLVEAVYGDDAEHRGAGRATWSRAADTLQPAQRHSARARRVRRAAIGGGTRVNFDRDELFRLFGGFSDGTICDAELERLAGRRCARTSRRDGCGSSSTTWRPGWRRFAHRRTWCPGGGAQRGVVVARRQQRWRRPRGVAGFDAAPGASGRWQCSARRRTRGGAIRTSS